MSNVFLETAIDRLVTVPDTGAVVEPTMMGGQLLTGTGLQEIVDDTPERWQFIPQHGGSDHYPGELFAQFLAWYNDSAGMYLACDDCEGNVKRMRPVRRDSGIRLGLAHLGDWPTTGERTIEYDVVLRSFVGDWYDAAEIYRSWSLGQKWGSCDRHSLSLSPDDSSRYCTSIITDGRDLHAFDPAV